MSIKEEQFLQSVKESFEGFSPEVPGHIYAAVQSRVQKRRAAFWMGFSMNTWLAVLGIAGAGLVLWGLNQQPSYPEAMPFHSATHEGVSTGFIYKAHRSIGPETGEGISEDETLASTSVLMTTKPASTTASRSERMASNNSNEGATTTFESNTLVSAEAEEGSQESAGNVDSINLPKAETEEDEVFTLPLKVKKVLKIERDAVDEKE